MDTDWINDLRVVDLKEELKKRDLPISGKKADLAARLQEAVLSEGGKGVQENFTPAVPEKQEDNATPGIDVGIDKNAEEKTEKAELSGQEEKQEKEEELKEEPEEPVPALPDSKADQKEQEAVAEVGKAANVGQVETPEAAQEEHRVSEGKETSNRAETDALEAADISKEAQKGDVTPANPQLETVAGKDRPGTPQASNEKQGDISPALQEKPANATAPKSDPTEQAANAITTKEEALPAMQAALLATQTAATEAGGDVEMEEAVDFEADDMEEEDATAKTADQGKEKKTSTKKNAAAAPAVEEPESKRQKTEEPGQAKRKREPILFQPKERSGSLQTIRSDNSQHAVTPSLDKKSSVFDRIGSLPSDPVRSSGGAPPTRSKPTRALLVTGFIRPFTVSAAQNLFKSYGDVETMWMPTIRDKAYVIYKSEEAAEAARQATYGLEWPHGNRTSLRPKFVSVEEAESAAHADEQGQAAPAKAGSEVAASQAAMKPAEASLERRKSDKANGQVEAPKAKEEQKVEEPEEKTLEDLFRKTKASPYLYWLPVSEDQVQARLKARQR